MKNRRILLLVGTMLAVAISLVCTPQGALAAGCTSQQSGAWTDAATWTSCGGGTPASGDSVTVVSGHTVTISGNPASGLTGITVGGTLQVGNSSSVTLDSPVSVSNGGVLRVGATSWATLYLGGGVTIDLGGTLSADGSSSVYYDGATPAAFTNDGAVTCPVVFNSTGNALGQTVGGTGTWMTVYIANNSTTVFATDPYTWQVTTLNVNVGGKLALGAWRLIIPTGTTVSNGGTIAGSGVFQTQGAVTLHQVGTFSAPLTVASGTTAVRGVLDGGVQVADGAILQVQNSYVVTLNADTTVAGGGELKVGNGGYATLYIKQALTLTGTLSADGSSSIYYDGATPAAFTNDGAVTCPVVFNSTGSALGQTVGGTGTWTTVYIANNSTTMFATDPYTWQVTTLNVNGGGKLALGAWRLIIPTGTTVSNGGTIAGSGGFQTQGAVTLHQVGTFSAPLTVASGTTAVRGVLDGGVQVADGAILQVQNSYVVTLNAATTVAGGGELKVGNGGYANLYIKQALTLTGTLSADGSSSIYYDGATPAAFTNDGAVTYPVTFNSTGSALGQTVGGTGTWTTVYIANNSTTVFATDPYTWQVTTLNVNGGGKLELGVQRLIIPTGTTVSNGGTIAGSGGFQTQGAVTLHQVGTFSAPLTVASGTTAVRGVLDGGVTVADGAILQVQNSYVVTLNADTTVAGGGELKVGNGGYATLYAMRNLTLNAGATLSGAPSSVIYYNGVAADKFTNNGTVTYPVAFNSTGSAVAQTLTGVGAWVSFSLNTTSLTIPTGSSATITGSVTGSGASTAKTQGTVTLSLTGSFGVPLTVDPGTTTADGIFTEDVTVNSSGTLKVTDAKSFTAGKNVTVNGVISGGTGATFYFNGADPYVFANNNSVTASVQFNNTASTLTQNLAGSSAWGAVTIVNSTVRTANSTSVTVNGTLIVRTGATLRVGATSWATLYLGGGVTIDLGGTLSADGSSSVYYNGATPAVFTNDGAVTCPVVFNSTGSALGQTVGGTGTWTTVHIANNSTTVFATDPYTWQVTTLNVNVGGKLALGAWRLIIPTGTTVSNGGTIAGSGVFQTQGAVTLHQVGTFSAPLTVASGTTAVRGVLDGGVQVADGAILQVQNSYVVTLNADTTVAGGGELKVGNGGYATLYIKQALTLTGTLSADGSSSIYYDGATPAAFTNDGAVTCPVVFNSTGSALGQTVGGAGTWTTVYIANNSTTVFATDPYTWQVTTLNVNGGGKLALGAWRLIIPTGTTVSNGGTIAGSGVFQTQGAVTLHQVGTFSAPLTVASGTTAVRGVLDGGVQVADGAILQVQNSYVVTLNAATTVAGGR